MNLLVTKIQKGGVKAIAEEVVRFIPFVDDLVKETPTTPALNNAVVSALLDTVKEMYQGQFVMMGQATIKPHDLIFLQDHRTNMKGPVFVKETLTRNIIPTA